MKAKRSAKKAKSTKTVRHSVVAPKRKHSLSDTTLLFLALFFVLAALFVVIIYKRQAVAFQKYLDSQAYRSTMFVPPTGKKSAPSPKMTNR